MNGQGWRCRLVAELILKTEPVALVETGTYRGTTTEWLSAFQLPVYTCEASAENFGFSRARLAAVSNVHILHMDSRNALREILAGPLASMREQPILFYLDAHWSADLPLADEIDIIFASAPHAIVLIDDFEVPGDPGYRYDDYGRGNTLSPAYLAPSVKRHGLATLYPTTPFERETGAKRGCVVLVTEDELEQRLAGVRLLRRRLAA
jgi:hypothetical protein